MPRQWLIQEQFTDQQVGVEQSQCAGPIIETAEVAGCEPLFNLMQHIVYIVPT